MLTVLQFRLYTMKTSVQSYSTRLLSRAAMVRSFRLSYSMITVLMAADHPRERGLGNNDLTSFLPAHKAWGKLREHRPATLFMLDVKKAPKNPALRNTVPLWYRGGRLVLDRNSKPMRYLPNILPATFSSAVEGWLLVAIFHMDRQVQINDILARMPQEVVLPKDKGMTGALKANTLSMRMTRFRLEAGLLPRETRSGSDSIEGGLKELLGNHCFTENSTRRFGRDLTEEEIQGLRAPNKGKFSQKSKSKTVKFITEPAKKRKQEDRGENLMYQAQEAQNQEVFPAAKRAKTQNSATGLVMPSPTVLGHFTSPVGMPDTAVRGEDTWFAGPPNDGQGAGTFEEESEAEFVTRLLQNYNSTGDHLLSEFDTRSGIAPRSQYPSPGQNQDSSAFQSDIPGLTNGTTSYIGQGQMRNNTATNPYVFYDNNGSTVSAGGSLHQQGHDLGNTTRATFDFHSAGLRSSSTPWVYGQDNPVGFAPGHGNQTQPFPNLIHCSTRPVRKTAKKPCVSQRQAYEARHSHSSGDDTASAAQVQQNQPIQSVPEAPYSMPPSATAAPSVTEPQRDTIVEQGSSLGLQHADSGDQWYLPPPPANYNSTEADLNTDALFSSGFAFSPQDLPVLLTATEPHVNPDMIDPDLVLSENWATWALDFNTQFPEPQEDVSAPPTSTEALRTQQEQALVDEIFMLDESSFETVGFDFLDL